MCDDPPPAPPDPITALAEECRASARRTRHHAERGSDILRRPSPEHLASLAAEPPHAE